jgi:hypothetical protein
MQVEEFDSFENIVEYDGKTFPKIEINIPLKGIWEFLGYLEISLECFDVALKYPKADFFMIKSQIGNYAKEKIEDFVSNNGYQEKDDEVKSFDLFNGLVYYNADLFYKLSCKNGFMEHYILEKHKELSIYDKVNGTDPKNIILKNHRIDLYPYIESEQFEKDFFNFLTTSDVYQSLYDCAKSDISANSKTLTDLRSLLLNKLYVINNKKNSYSDTLLSTLTNQTLINWYILLQKYIDMATSLLDAVATSKLETKLIVYILKTLCKNGMGIDITDDAFVSLTKKLVGTSLSTTEKYLRSSDMGYRQGFADTWLEGLKLLSSLDKENPLIRKSIRVALIEDRPVKLDKPLTAEQEEFIQKLKKDYPAPDSEN